MSFFRKQAEPQPPAAPPSPQERPKSEVPVSTLSSGVNFSMAGDKLTWESPAEDLNIQGRFEGNLRVRTLMVGPGAVVRGTIVADKLIVEGRVEGDTRAIRVSLLGSAHILGQLTYGEMVMKQGARLSATVICEPGQGEGAGSDRSALPGHNTPINDGMFPVGGRPRLVDAKSSASA